MRYQLRSYSSKLQETIYWINDTDTNYRTEYHSYEFINGLFNLSGFINNDNDTEDELIVEANTLEELKQKVPYLFL